MEVVTLLVGIAKQLYAAKLAAEHNGREVDSLFERLRDNTLLIQAAVLQDLHVSSTDPALATALRNTMGRVVRTLAEARDAFYKYLLSGK